MAAAVSDFAASITGRVLQPTDAGFEEARRMHNGMIDKRPDLIVQCRGAADVADAVKFARTAGLEIAVRGGGHNVGGRGSVDDGLVVDLSLMRGVHVDARRRIAVAQGGVLWREFNRETQLHALATTGGVVGSTGVAGLTLGGGIGWLMAKHGLALDNLLSVELVTADGAVVRAAADEHADLFWAVRGGGGNFGVATSFEFQLHPLGPMVTGGLIAYPVSRARDLLRLYRDLTAAADDDLMLVAALLTAPDGATKLCAIAAAHFGAPEAAQAALRPLKDFGTPALDALGPIPYTALNALLDAAYPSGARNYWKSHFLDSLPDAAIDVLVDAFDRCPSPMSNIILEHFHGAATRVAPDATAYALRSTGYNLLFLSQWSDPADDEAGIAWARRGYAAVQPFGSAHRYLNYMDSDEAAEPTLAAVYAANLPRLRDLKRRHDPDNVFHINLNIPPA